MSEKRIIRCLECNSTKVFISESVECQICYQWEDPECRVMLEDILATLHKGDDVA